MRLTAILIAMTVMLPSTVLISYLIAVNLDHVEAAFPFISNTGTIVPESCVFGQMLNMSAVLYALIVYFRYFQVKEYARIEPKVGNLNRLNMTCLVSGCLSAFGMSIVANFQVGNMFIVHMIGAFMAFMIQILYLACSTSISFKLAPYFNSRNMALFRTAITVFYIISFFGTYILSYMSVSQYDGPNTQFWTQDAGGWAIHVVASVCEWTMGLLIVFYVVSYHEEFLHSNVGHPEIKFHPNLLSKSPGNRLEMSIKI